MQRINEAQFCRSNPETRARRCNPQIASKRKAAAPANAIPLDHGDGRQAEAGQFILGTVDRRLIGAAPSGIIFVSQQFLNVRASTKSARAGRADNHQFDIMIGARLLQQGRDGLPHFQIEGIAHICAVNQQMCGPILNFQPYTHANAPQLPRYATQARAKLCHRFTARSAQYRPRAINCLQKLFK